MTNLARLSLLTTVLLAGCASAPPLAVTPCSTYCSSYEEGYQWAQGANLSDPRNCEGYASDFVRGCQQQVTDRQQSFAPRQGF